MHIQGHVCLSGKVCNPVTELVMTSGYGSNLFTINVLGDGELFTTPVSTVEGSEESMAYLRNRAFIHY